MTAELSEQVHLKSKFVVRLRGAETVDVEIRFGMHENVGPDTMFMLKG